MEGVYISNYSLCIWNSVLTEHPLFAKSCNLGSWSRYLTLCLSFLTCKVRLRNTYLIGAVMRIRGVNIAKYLTQGLFVVQLLSPVWLFAIPWTAACQASLSFTVSWSLLKFMSIELVLLSEHCTLCHPLLLFAFNLSQHQIVFQRVSSSHQIAKVLELQLQHQSFQWIFKVEFL